MNLWRTKRIIQSEFFAVDDDQALLEQIRNFDDGLLVNDASEPNGEVTGASGT